MSIVDSIEKQQDTFLKLDGGLQLEEGANTEKHDPPAYCGICRGNVGHWWETCPYKEKGCGEYCGVCDGPAKEECKRDHAEDVWVTMKWCVYCGEMFDHWENECPLGEDIGLDDYS